MLTLTGTNHSAVTVKAAAGDDTVAISDGIGADADATTVSIVATDATGGEPGADDGVFTVALAGGKLAPDGGITVAYAVSGTASAGSDYTAMSGTVTIPGGQSSAILVVDVLDDSIVELPETVIVTLTGTNHPGVTIAATGNTATATIQDDDSDDRLDRRQRSQRCRTERQRPIDRHVEQRQSGAARRHRWSATQPPAPRRRAVITRR